MAKDTGGTEWRTVRITQVFYIEVMADNDDDARYLAELALPDSDMEEMYLEVIK